MIVNLLVGSVNRRYFLRILFQQPIDKVIHPRAGSNCKDNEQQSKWFNCPFQPFGLLRVVLVNVDTCAISELSYS